MILLVIMIRNINITFKKEALTSIAQFLDLEYSYLFDSYRQTHHVL